MFCPGGILISLATFPPLICENPNIPKCNRVEIGPNGSDEAAHDVGFGDIHHHIQMKLIQFAGEDLVLVRHIYHISGDLVLGEGFGETSCGLSALRHGNGSNDI